MPGTPSKLVTGQPQIFVDDELVLRKEGVRRRIHPCNKLDHPVISGPEPWEPSDVDPRVYLYGTVLRDPHTGLLRMWYMRYPDRVLYAASDDGIHWDRPALGFEEIPDSNGLPIPFHSPSMVHDPRNPESVYTMLGCARSPSGKGYCIASSDDGLRWILSDGNPILPGGDTCTLSFDPATGQYRAFHKRTHGYRGHQRRLVYLSTSSDTRNWSEPTLAVAPDEIDDQQTRDEGGLFSQFYNMAAFLFGGQWLGLVTHFRYNGPPQTKERGQSPHDGPIDVQLVHSRDGVTWCRCEDRSPIIPNGPHAYDAGCILGVANQPVRVGDEHWVYYTGITTTHGGALPEKQVTVARGAWRRDGWVSLDGGPGGGTVETIAMLPQGEQLIVNVDATRGSLEVELSDETGASLPGFAFSDCEQMCVDNVQLAVRWRGHSSLPTDRAVRLRFRLTNASIYSYTFEPTHPA